MVLCKWVDSQPIISHSAINGLECCFANELSWPGYSSVRKSFMMTKGRELIIAKSKEWLNSPITVSEDCQKEKKLISSA